MKRHSLKTALLTASLVVVPILMQPPPVHAATYKVHTVQWGDSLYLLSQRYGVSVDAIRKANGISGNTIYAGQSIRIPISSRGSSSSSFSYSVKAGDTLYLLAKRFGTTVQSLRVANNIWTDFLYVGQTIKIPSGSTNSGGSATPGSSAFSAEDLDLLARLVTAEAGGESHAGKVAVAATVLNRVKDPNYPDTIPGVIYQVVDGKYYQYSPVLNGTINQPADPDAVKAVQEALAGYDPTFGATGFYNPNKTSNQWVRSRPVTTQIGNHVFFQ